MGSEDTSSAGRVNYKERKAHRTSFVMYPADEELLDLIVGYLGCSRSEAMRSAIRAFATNLPLKGRDR